MDVRGRLRLFRAPTDSLDVVRKIDLLGDAAQPDDFTIGRRESDDALEVLRTKGQLLIEATYYHQAIRYTHTFVSGTPQWSFEFEFHVASRNIALNNLDGAELQAWIWNYWERNPERMDIGFVSGSYFATYVMVVPPQPPPYGPRATLWAVDQAYIEDATWHFRVRDPDVVEFTTSATFTAALWDDEDIPIASLSPGPVPKYDDFIVDGAGTMAYVWDVDEGAGIVSVWITDYTYHDWFEEIPIRNVGNGGVNVEYLGPIFVGPGTTSQVRDDVFDGSRNYRLDIPDVEPIDSLTSTETSKSLSANMGRVLAERIEQTPRLVNYSVEPVNTGVRWVDGSFVWRRVIIATTGPLVVQANTVLPGGWPFNGIVRLDGYCIWPNGNRVPIGYVEADGEPQDGALSFITWFNVWMKEDGSIMEHHGTTHFNNLPLIIILDYITQPTGLSSWDNGTTAWDGGITTWDQV